ncbi:MAG TPA: AMP-binding protein [Frankiaceae bacterium]|jgi:long-chain acyl-CoA synthetase|nr:AMP-binding protein [Frankiaceae bacterium]
MSAEPGRRDEPFWAWAAGEPDRVVLSVPDGLDVAAAELAGLLRAAPSGDDPVAVVARALAEAYAGEPGERDAAARMRTLATDAAGFTAGGAAVVLLPLDKPATLDVVAGLVHSHRRAVLPPVLSVSATARALEDAVDLVTSRAAVERLAGTGALARLRPGGRVVALGPLGGTDLRARLRDDLGRDALVEVGQDPSGAESIAVADGEDGEGFWSWARGRPDSPALLDSDGTVVSAGTLLERATRLAAAVRDTVAFDAAAPPALLAALPDPADLVTAYLAACLGGFHLVPLAPHATDADAAHLRGAAGVVATLGALDIARLVERGGPDVPPGPAGGLLPYTSGTTGAPKIVRHPPERMTAQLRAAREVATAARVGIAGPGRHLVTVPLHNGAALTTASWALHAGQALVVLREWSPVAALDAMRRHEVTTAFFVPSMFDALRALPEDVRGAPSPSLRAVVHSAAPCPVPTKHAMLDWWGPVLYERYGATEAPGTYVTPHEWLARPGTVGRPFPGVRVRVLDDEGRDRAPGEPGRVYLTDRGARYAGGGAPDARDGFVSVGDVGYLDEEGWLFLIGRETDYISVGGAKFHPSEVERVLGDHPYVADAAVVPVPHSRLGEVPVAYVVPAPGCPADQADVTRALGAYAREHLPPVRRPLRFRLIPALPRNAAGKVLRHELAADAAGPPAPSQGGHHT